MRRSRFLATVLVILVMIGGALFAWRWQQRGPGRASVSGAVGRFRASSTVGSTPRSLQPRSGVYLYSGTGKESLSFLGTSQSQGPSMPGTVVLRPNGCWTFRIDYNSFHAQTWNRCWTGGRLTESGGSAVQRFDFVSFKISEHSTVTCDPPIVVADLAAAPGAKWDVHCTGRSQTTKTTLTQTGVAKFVGLEKVNVGGAGVSALHSREDLQLSGGQTGSVRVDIWLASADGLPLKEAHDINVVTPAPAPLNHVTYTERGTWQLKSMTPRT